MMLIKILQEMWRLLSFRSILGIGSNTESLTYAELYDADCKHPSFTDVAFVGGV